MEYEDFLKALRWERKQKGMSLQEMSKALGISLGKLSAFERGRTPLKVKDYLDICGVLQISPVELMGGTNLSAEQHYVADKIKNLSERDFRIIKDLIILMESQIEDL